MLQQFTKFSFAVFIILTLFVHKSFASSTVLLNEIAPCPQAEEKEWVELFNVSENPVDTGGWNIEEKTSTGNTLSHSLPGISLPAKSGCYFEFVSSVLNNDKETVTLKDGAGLIADEYSYTQAQPGKTFSRIPDGADWQQLTLPTKTFPNCTQLVVLPSPTPTPSPQPAQTPSPSPSASGRFFTITADTASLDSDQTLTIKISAGGLSASSVYYLKAAFFKEGSTNYFGQTLVSGDWARNGQSYLDQLRATTDAQGNLQTDLKAMADTDDSGYSGSGNYYLKVARYTSSGSGPSWSNQLSISITDVTPAKAELNKAVGGPLSSATPSASVNTQKMSSFDQNLIEIPQLTDKKEASVEGTTAAQIDNYNYQRPVKINLWLAAAGIAIALAAIIASLLYFKKPLYDKIFNIWNIPAIVQFKQNELLQKLLKALKTNNLS